MHANSGNIELMLYDNSNEVVDKLFRTFPSRYQATSIRESDFIFDSV